MAGIIYGDVEMSIDEKRKNPIESTNKSTVQALTPSEMQSLREDLKQSVIQAREIIARTPCKVDFR